MKTLGSRGASAVLGLLAALSMGAALAETGTARRDASIPFADHGGIYDWRADGDRGLWVQSRNREWYYATFMGNCTGLNFANSIGFDTRPLGTFDRFSAIVVPRWGRCTIQSLAPSDGPPGAPQRGG